MGGFEEEDDRVDTGSLLRSALPQLPDLTGLRFPQVISSTYAGSADLQANREVLLTPVAAVGVNLEGWLPCGPSTCQEITVPHLSSAPLFLGYEDHLLES